MPLRSDNLSDEQILFIVGQVDAEMCRAGIEISQRSWEVPRKVMSDLGYIGYVMAGFGKPGILDRVESAFRSIYRPQDLAVGGHIGVFMYRDIFARISVPHIVGRTGFNPFQFVELTPTQLRIIQTEPDQIAIYLDQFSDVADIQYGFSELRPPHSKEELVVRFLGLARLQLHAAAAVLTGGYDYRGAVQSALLACELALKAGVATQGLSEAAIKKKFGHDLAAVADSLGAHCSGFDVDRVRRVISAQPQYVPNRYSPTQPNRQDVGRLVMGSQYIVSEVIRQLSDRNFRTGLNPPAARQFPA